MHHAFGILTIIGLIAFAFGATTARAIVAVGLLAAIAALVYVMFRVATGTI